MEIKPRQQQDEVSLGEIDIVYDMSKPDFQSPEHDWITNTDLQGVPADGTVLFLNELLFDDNSSVLIKSSLEDVVHLVVDTPLIESDVLSSVSTDDSQSAVMHHYYEFPNDLKVYSEHSLQLIYLEG